MTNDRRKMPKITEVIKIGSIFRKYKLLVILKDDNCLFGRFFVPCTTKRGCVSKIYEAYFDDQL